MTDEIAFMIPPYDPTSRIREILKNAGKAAAIQFCSKFFNADKCKSIINSLIK